MTARLDGRVAIVTGGAGRLGQVYAQRLSTEGAAVCIWDIDIEGAKQTAFMIEEAGGKAVSLEVDITSEDETASAAKATFDRFEAIDILVNNAGGARGYPRVPIEDAKLSDWIEIVNMNMTGTFLVTKAVVPYMKQRGKGKIINIASGLALHGGLIYPGYIARQDYVAAKGGIISLTRAFAVEFGPHFINANVVVVTQVAPPEWRDKPLETIPEGWYSNRSIRRPVFPDDLAGAVVFLASDDSDMITGQVINVDGGRVFIN